MPRTGNVPGPRQSWAWQKLRAQRKAIGKAAQEECCRCGGAIDYSLPGTHRWGPTVDHLRPLLIGGEALPDLEGLGMAHLACNTRHGARMKARTRKRTTSASSATSTTPERPRPTLEAVPAPRPTPEPEGVWAHLAGHFDTTDMPADASPPRLFSPPHPRAVGTYATTLLPWIDARLAGSGQSLRWFQRIILERAWEHDEEGRLVWRQVVVSTPRQAGKSILTREHALARASHPGLFGAEPQTIIHSSRTINNATLIHSGAWAWAEEQGLKLSRRFGSERVR